MHKKTTDEFDKKFLKKLLHKEPFFLFSKKRILHNLDQFKEFFPGALIQYAMKANAEQVVLQTVFESGAGFEVASKYELDMLKKIRVPGDKIIYGTSVKPALHIKEFFDYGVDRFSFDSLPELEKIAKMAPGSKVYVRIVVNDVGSVFRFREKFGTEKENIIPFLSKAKELGLQPYGISFHVGSQASDIMAWANALEIIPEIMSKLSRLGIMLDVINIGGGFPCNTYLSSEEKLPLKEIAFHTLDRFNKLPYQPKLMIEPGRGIIADTGILVTSIIGKAERKRKTWLFLDVGVYGGLFESMVFQGATRYRTSCICKNNKGGKHSFALAGPTGDSPDVITREVFLPRNIDVGDKIIFHDIGAYSIPAISPFNGFPKPEVYFVDQEDAKIYYSYLTPKIKKNIIQV